MVLVVLVGRDEVEVWAGGAAMVVVTSHIPEMEFQRDVTPSCVFSCSYTT